MNRPASVKKKTKKMTQTTAKKASASQSASQAKAQTKTDVKTGKVKQVVNIRFTGGFQSAKPPVRRRRQPPKKKPSDDETPQPPPPNVPIAQQQPQPQIITRVVQPLIQQQQPQLQFLPPAQPTREQGQTRGVPQMARRQAPNEVGDSASEAIRAWRSELASFPTTPTTETPPASILNAISKEADRRLDEVGFVAPRGSSSSGSGEYNRVSESGFRPTTLMLPSEIDDTEDEQFNRVADEPLAVVGPSDSYEEALAEQEQLLAGVATESAGAGPSFLPPTADEFESFVRELNPTITGSPSRWASGGSTKSGWARFFTSETPNGMNNLIRIATQLGIPNAQSFSIAPLREAIGARVKELYKK